MPAIFKKAKKVLLFVRLIGYSLRIFADIFARAYTTKKIASNTTSKDATAETINIVIFGASFAGYHAARLIALSLPTDGPYRLIIIEPNSHWQFTWTLPRFCVVEGHEAKTFIPYGPYLPAESAPIVRWIHDRVSTISEKMVTIQGTGEEISYSHMVIATGSGVEFQQRIKTAKHLVVVGGGAAGVELATDAKDQYPEKSVTLVHSRDVVMNRFGPELQAGAHKGLEDLGVEVILGERTATDAPVDGFVTLRSGRKLECDFLVNAIGQQPSSHIVSELAPEAIAKSGRIKVKPTMQINVDSLPNIYVCGDVAETGVTNPNARSAMKQAMFAADNLVLSLQGKKPSYFYQPAWADAVIKLTLGLHKSITAFGSGGTELLINGKEKEVTLMIKRTWQHMGATPYEDKEANPSLDKEPAGDKALELKNEVV
ncbi:hypothetical protein CcaCcLH18_02553 [Colletotrichum camelliae]|nr:hypothetical protein CcaCcLH18_02553 [Colletotrichum camelliae]